MVQLIRALAVLAALAFAGAAHAASAVDATDPRAVVEAAYQPYVAANFDWSSYDDSIYRSASLNALYARDAKESEAAGEVGRLDFDPLINGQDYEITKLDIGKPTLKGDTAMVEVTFENFDTPSTLDIALVKEGGGWLIDDVVSLEGEVTYSLRDILEAPYP